MNPNKKLRVAAIAVVLAASAAPFVAMGCDEANPLDALCCSQFKVGAELTGLNWGLDGQANVEFGASMQAIGDFAASANAVVNDLANECKALAIELGADPEAVTREQEADPVQKAELWCAEATGQINVVVEGNVTVSIQPPHCGINVSAQASCEGECSANAACEVDPGSIEARCTGGEISGKCTGECSGKCEGSANLAVACEGACAGTCEGNCMGMQDGGKCDGVCNGTCRGTCEIEAGATAECEGQCTGECSVEFIAPTCTAEVNPPSAECNASADCQASCKASASAKAECTPPSIEIVATGDISAAAIGSLRLHLPAIFLFHFKATEFWVGSVGELASSAEGLLNAGLNLQAGACIAPAFAAVVQAQDNVEAAASASTNVRNSITTM